MSKCSSGLNKAGEKKLQRYSIGNSEIIPLATKNAFSHLSKLQRGSRNGSFSHCDTWYHVVRFPLRESGTLYFLSTVTVTSICHGTYSREEGPRDGSD